MNCQRLDVAMVRHAAQGRWHSILQALEIRVPNNPRTHAPCPTCGGTDRFRFDDRDGLGTWFCNKCNRRAGDGIALVMNVLHIQFREALVVVAGVVGIDTTAPSQRSHLQLPPVPQRVDRRAIAFRFEMAALDLRLRAGRIGEAAAPINIDNFTDAELDHALGLVAQGHADVARAELFELVADRLRLRDFTERKQS